MLLWEVTASGYSAGWWRYVVYVLGYNHFHAFQSMLQIVTVEEPPSWIVSFKSHNDIGTRWNNNCIFEGSKVVGDVDFARELSISPGNLAVAPLIGITACDFLVRAGGGWKMAGTVPVSDM